MEVNKRGQMKMSFGMIFSIILILIFIVFSFSIIKSWLDLGTTTQVESFINTLQKDVNKSWKNTQTSQTIKYSLPSKIEKVCFVDYSSPAIGAGRSMQDYIDETYSDVNNLFFYPKGAVEGTGNRKIQNINITKITVNSNPFCINNVNGKVLMILQKNYNEVLVTIN